MNIHVLCVNCQSFRKTKYSSVFSEDTNLSYSRCTGNVLAVEKALKKAAGNWRNQDYIIVDHALGRNSDKSFRKLFAGIIYRYEKTIQEDPKVTAKKLKKAQKAEKKEETTTYESTENTTESEENVIHYDRKKTHIFTVEINGLVGYAFSYAENKIVVLPKGLSANDIPAFIEKAQQLYDDNSEKYPEGYSLEHKTYKILNFREKYIPMKGDTTAECARKITQLSAACVFFIAGFLLIYNMVFLPMENTRLQSEIQTIFYETMLVKLTKYVFLHKKSHSPEKSLFLASGSFKQV